jgi:predicted alternative tryptophan synthase beta-subunit
MNTAILKLILLPAKRVINCIVSATGNGEWGAALAFACIYFGLE